MLTSVALLTRLHLGGHEYKPSKVTIEGIRAIREYSGTLDTFIINFIVCILLCHDILYSDRQHNKYFKHNPIVTNVTDITNKVKVKENVKLSS
jgi:hypothetical protein